MSAAIGHWILLASPFVVALAFWIVAARNPAPGQTFFQRNGVVVGSYLLVGVGLWMMLLILLPQISMIELSFRPKLPPMQTGGPLDVYTLQNYKYFLHGGGSGTAGWNSTHLWAFALTILASMLVTIIDFAICYPLAFYMAKVAKPAAAAGSVAAADPALLGQRDSARLRFSDHLRHHRHHQPGADRHGSACRANRFLRQQCRAVRGPVLRLRAADDVPAVQRDREPAEGSGRGGARPGRALVAHPPRHRRPARETGHRLGGTLVFMLCSGALAAPLILGGPRTLWFTPIVYDRFYQAFNWPQGSAYALVLLLTCVLFVLFVLRVSRLNLGAITQ